MGSGKSTRFQEPARQSGGSGSHYGKENANADMDLDLSAFEIGMCFKDLNPDTKSGRQYLNDIQDARDMDTLVRICRNENGQAIRGERVAEIYLSMRALCLEGKNSNTRAVGEQLLRELEGRTLMKIRDFTPRQVNSARLSAVNVTVCHHDFNARKRQSCINVTDED